MTIYFSPWLEGRGYAGKGQWSIGLNEMITGLQGLSSQIMLRLGLNIVSDKSVDREVLYYHWVERYVNDNPNCVISKSFSVDPVSVSHECLAMTDFLKSYSWNEDNESHSSVSDRLSVLAGILRKAGEDRCLCRSKYLIVKETIESALSGTDDFNGKLKNIKVVCLETEKVKETAYDPICRFLLDVVVRCGGAVECYSHKVLSKEGTNLNKIQNLLTNRTRDNKVTLNPLSTDKSVKIIDFDSPLDAAEYIVLNSDKFSNSVFVSSDNLLVNSLEKRAGFSPSGCRSEGCKTQILQLFICGINIMNPDLRLQDIVSFLVFDVNPVSQSLIVNDRDELLRMVLARKMASSGGLDKNFWQETVAKSCDSDISSIERINNILPLWYDKLTCGLVRRHCSVMAEWARTTALESDCEMSEQLSLLAVMEERLMSVIGENDDEVIEFDNLLSKAMAVYSLAHYSITFEPKENCRHTMYGLHSLNRPVDNLIYADFGTKHTFSSEADKLTTSEREGLRRLGIDIVSNEALTFALSEIEERMFTMVSDSVTLLRIRRPDDSSRHSSDITLEYLCDGWTSLYEKVRKEDIRNESNVYLSESSLVDNSVLPRKLFDSKFEGHENDEDFELKKIDAIKCGYVDLGISLPVRDSESYSSLRLFIDYPLDYVMRYIAGFDGGSLVSMPNEHLMRGNVAHHLIGTLFDPKKTGGISSNIRREIEERFDEVFDSAIILYYADMLRTENSSLLDEFRNTMRKCAVSLCQTLCDLYLKVTYIEKRVFADYVISEDTSLVGFLDMTLEDEAGNIVIFDLKWGNADRYKNMLEAGDAIQLCLYTAIEEKREKKNVSGVAYFVMPTCRLITTDERLIASDYSVFIDSIRPGDCMDAVKESYRYRLSELESGLVEFADGISHRLFSEAMGDEHVISRPEETDGTVASNQYSDYYVFKTELR